MKLKNFANIPDDKVKETIEFVKPNGLATPIYDVIVKNGHSGNGGHFYPSCELIAKYAFYQSLLPRSANIIRSFIISHTLLNFGRKINSWTDKGG
jgi:hypothetical protein